MTRATIEATITFATPFRVGTGIPGDSVDQRIDHGDPLPASAIKGLMRQEARNLLGVRPTEPAGDPLIIQQVFGAPWTPSPWHWAVRVTGRLSPAVRVNVRLNDDGQVVPGALMLAEEAVITEATLTITQMMPLGDQLARHRALLRLSAGLVEKIGQKRTRGLGWARIEVTAPAWDTDLAELRAMTTPGETP